MAETEVEVLYCWRCGKRVQRRKELGSGKCWYCDAATIRTIRPPRLCPFCEQVIPATAIKCHHCSEFLDGRERSEDVALDLQASRIQQEREQQQIQIQQQQLQLQQQQPTQQITFVIDKAVIGTDQPLTLTGGQQLPPDIQARLTHQTAEAIASNRADLIDQPGIKALPALAADTPAAALPGPGQEIPPAPAQPAQPPAQPSASTAAPAMPPAPAGAQFPVVPSATPGQALAPASSQPSGGALVPQQGGGALVPTSENHPVVPFQKAPRKKVVRKRKVKRKIKKAEPESRYAICKVCLTEVLSADNYCFHCGTVLRQEAAGKRRKESVYYPSNALYYALSFLVMALYVFVGLRPEILGTVGLEISPTLAVLGLSGITLLLLVAAFFRRRTFFSQFLTLLMVVLWFATTVAVLLKSI